MDWWQKDKVDERNFTKTISDICKFLLDQCCDVNGDFFYLLSKLGTNPKFEKLRQWRSGDINMIDYKLPELFDD